jgi:ABC-type transport system involved in multi-copper enzyme maturation permease subunit
VSDQNHSAAPLPVAAPAAVRPAPSFLTAALRIFDFSVGQMLWSRRTIFLGLVVSAPVVVALILRIVAAAFQVKGALRVEGGLALAGPSIFAFFIWVLYLRVVVPALGVFYGTALVADEVEDKTITYLFTRPIPRGAVLVGKYLAYLVATALVVLPSVMVVYFLVVPMGGGRLGATFPALLKDLALLAVGLATYGALFAWVGARFKRPLVMGLVFAFGWEQLIMLVPGYLKRLTIVYYIQGLVPHAMPQDGVMSLVQTIVADRLATGWALLALALIWAGFLYLASRTVDTREYVLEQ